MEHLNFVYIIMYFFFDTINKVQCMTLGYYFIFFVIIMTGRAFIRELQPDSPANRSARRRSSKILLERKENEQEYGSS